MRKLNFAEHIDTMCSYGIREQLEAFLRAACEILRNLAKSGSAIFSRKRKVKKVVSEFSGMEVRVELHSYGVRREGGSLSGFLLDEPLSLVRAE